MTFLNVQSIMLTKMKITIIRETFRSYREDKVFCEYMFSFHYSRSISFPLLYELSARYRNTTMRNMETWIQ